MQNKLDTFFDQVSCYLPYELKVDHGTSQMGAAIIKMLRKVDPRYKAKNKLIERGVANIINRIDETHYKVSLCDDVLMFIKKYPTAIANPEAYEETRKKLKRIKRPSAMRMIELYRDLESGKSVKRVQPGRVLAEFLVNLTLYQYKVSTSKLIRLLSIEAVRLKTIF